MSRVTKQQSCMSNTSSGDRQRTLKTRRSDSSSIHTFPVGRDLNFSHILRTKLLNLKCKSDTMTYGTFHHNLKLLSTFPKWSQANFWVHTHPALILWPYDRGPLTAVIYIFWALMRAVLRQNYLLTPCGVIDLIVWVNHTRDKDKPPEYSYNPQSGHRASHI